MTKGTAMKQLVCAEVIPGGVASLDRLRALPAEEDGAQAVEYAMIGGLGAGLIGLIWTLLSKSDAFGRLLRVLLDHLVKSITSWF